MNFYPAMHISHGSHPVDTASTLMDGTSMFGCILYSDMAFDSTAYLPKALVTLPKCRLLLKYLQTNFVVHGG